MSDVSDTAATRQTAIVEAATGVFLRDGYKKTSMDDVARVVGISRQALYLHFENKDALFKATVAHSIEPKAALVHKGIDLEERPLGAFEAMDGKVVGIEHLGELIATTATLVGPVFREAERAVVAEVARALHAAGVAAR